MKRTITLLLFISTILALSFLFYDVYVKNLKIDPPTSSDSAITSADISKDSKIDTSKEIDNESPPLTPTDGLDSIIFKKEDVPEEIYEKMLGVTIHKNSIMNIDDLSYITITYYGYDNNLHIGEIIMDEKLADEIIEIFKILLDNKFPIEKMVLPDVYGGTDELSMQDNNTSGFNDRTINDSGALSFHQLGRAIDINPLYNPYINYSTGDLQPTTAEIYLDRDEYHMGMIQEDDICVKTFKEKGWEWGGDWNSVKDYQHFEKAN